MLCRAGATGVDRLPLLAAAFHGSDASQ